MASRVTLVQHLTSGTSRRRMILYQIGASTPFVKSNTFRILSGGGDETSDWMREERTLAATMKMTYVLFGDSLAQRSPETALMM